MKAWIALLMMTTPLSVAAAECDRWTASMEEDEGGSVMMAHTCAPAGNAAHELYVQCGSPGELSIRFIPVAPTGYPPAQNYTTELEFSIDQEMFTRPARYEDMDGAMATEPKIDSPFVNALQARNELTVSDTADKVPGATFTLNGSKAALAKVIATCSRQ
jgi:hypothetical protein